jgi:hypothetical protein
VYTESELYAPFCAMSWKSGTTSGKLWLSTICQWNVLSYTIITVIGTYAHRTTR